MQNRLDEFDTVKLTAARDLIQSIHEFNYVSAQDPLSSKLTTVLHKIDHILEQYGKEDCT